LSFNEGCDRLARLIIYRQVQRRESQDGCTVSCYKTIQAGCERAGNFELLYGHIQNSLIALTEDFGLDGFAQ
jgi:hypothetical protein